MHYRDFPANKKILLLCALLLTVGFVNAARAEKIAIPQDLQQWVPWVLHEQQEKTCTLLTASGASSGDSILNCANLFNIHCVFP